MTDYRAYHTVTATTILLTGRIQVRTALFRRPCLFGFRFDMALRCGRPQRVETERPSSDGAAVAAVCTWTSRWESVGSVTNGALSTASNGFTRVKADPQFILTFFNNFAIRQPGRVAVPHRSANLQICKLAHERVKKEQRPGMKRAFVCLQTCKSAITSP